MRAVSVRYRLVNGAAGTLTMIATSTAEALLRVFDLFPDQVRMASARGAA